MSTVNRVFLMGVVATPPRRQGRQWRMVVTLPGMCDGAWCVQRIPVAASGAAGDVVATLATAQAVYVDGRLRHLPSSVLVDAATVIALGDPPAQPSPQPVPLHSHASPRAHQRAGHPRRIHIGTPAERVVWVRPTRVGEG